MHWIEADNGYALALDGGKLVARNAKGKVLTSVPKAVRESPAGEQLLQLRDWLNQHQRECRAAVESWMLLSQAVPSAVLREVWPDPDWRAPLLNLLIETPDQKGFLRDITSRGLGLVDLDGESLWIQPEQVTIPHPILVQDLAEYREVLTELQLTQTVNQLFRECWPLPQPDLKNVRDFADGKFEQILHAHSRAKNLGYPVRGGFACCSVQSVQARFWIGAGSPEEETCTGDLTWVNSQEAPLSAHQAGGLAYSEGMRMASQIYAGRVVEKEAP